jgi:RNA polymerase primary sigma factor
LTTTPPTIDPLDHKGLVCGIALQFRNRGVELDDLIQEGQMGLLRACELFDPSRGFKFSTYASYWVKHYMRRALQESGFIRLPAYIHQAIRDTERPEPKKIPANRRACVKAALDVRRRQIARSSDLAAGGADLAELALDRDCEPLDEETMHEVVRAILTLPERPRMVLRLRYGLYGHERMTQVEIAAKFGITRQRVHQLEHEALAELKKRLEAA